MHLCLQIILVRGQCVNTLGPRQNRPHGADDIFRFSRWKILVFDSISLKFILKFPIDNRSLLARAMAWRRTGDRPSSGPMWPRRNAHILPMLWIYGLLVCSCLFSSSLDWFIQTVCSKLYIFKVFVDSSAQRGVCDWECYVLTRYSMTTHVCVGNIGHPWNS